MAGLRYSPALAGLARNRSLPAELRGRFVARADAELCHELADRDDLSPAEVRTLVTRGGAGAALRLAERGRLGVADIDPLDPHLVLAAIDLPDAPPAWAIELAKHPDPLVRESLAGSTSLGADVLAELAGDAVVEVVAAAARSTRLTAALAETLARHPHVAVRRALAGNDHAPPAVLAGLAAGAQPWPDWCSGCDGRAETPHGLWCDGGHEGALIDLQATVAGNPATPPSALSGYVDHPAMSVRWVLASRADLPPEAYRKLSLDPIPGVRGDVAGNPAIDEALIRFMADDVTEDVQRRLAHHPAIPLDVLAGLAARTRIGAILVPRIASATTAEVETVARSPVAAMRMLLAQRPDLPAAVVRRLAEDPDAKVLKSIAPNPAVTDAQLRAMVREHGVRVAVGVASNPRCAAELLHQLVVREPARRSFRVVAAHPNAAGETLLACLTDRRARPIAAGHPALPVDALLALVSDADPGVARAAAANPSLPYVVMELLIDTCHSAGNA